MLASIQMNVLYAKMMRRQHIHCCEHFLLGQLCEEEAVLDAKRYSIQHVFDTHVMLHRWCLWYNGNAYKLFEWMNLQREPHFDLAIFDVRCGFNCSRLRQNHWTIESNRTWCLIEFLCQSVGEGGSGDDQTRSQSMAYFNVRMFQRLMASCYGLSTLESLRRSIVLKNCSRRFVAFWWQIETQTTKRM